MKTFAFIFARGGSKGISGKNIKKMCGKPLIAYSIELAKDIECIDRIFGNHSSNIKCPMCRNKLKKDDFCPIEAPWRGLLPIVLVADGFWSCTPRSFVPARGTPTR